MKCPACGTDNRLEVRFCRHCGQKLSLNPAPSGSAEATLIPIPPSHTVCSVCGAAVKATSRFCPRCGQALGKPTSPQPQPPVMPGTAQTHDSGTSSTNQMPANSAPVTPTTQSSPEQLNNIAAPMVQPPASVNITDRQHYTLEDKNKKERKANKLMPGWVWGAIIGIIVLLMTLIILAVVFIPQILQGTGLVAADTTATSTVESPAPTVTPTPSASPTIEPTPTLKPTTAPLPMDILSAASVGVSSTAEIVSVGSQVIITVSIINESNGLIIPLRSDLIGEIAPTLKPAENITYTVNLVDGSSPLSPGATHTIVYRLDATESGTATLGASVLIEVSTPGHRQSVQSPIILVTVQ